MPDDNKPAIVHLNHEPMILRVDEIVEGEGGIKCAKLVGEIPLARGRNEVDPELWAKWREQNKDGPLLACGSVHEEVQQQEEKRDDEAEESERPAGEPDGSGGAHGEQG